MEFLDHAHLSHFEWHGDHLISTICKHKKDQDGSGLGKTKSLYANPHNPLLCVVLALAIYIISKPRSETGGVGSDKLFEGCSQKKRFAEFITKILSEYTDDEILQFFGTTVEALGSHSIRKYIIDLLTSILDGPNACAVYIRAGWSLGNTQDRYILGGMGEDNLIGRYIYIYIYIYI